MHKPTEGESHACSALGHTLLLFIHFILPIFAEQKMGKMK
jgi:hypothetical protein